MIVAVTLALFAQARSSLNPGLECISVTEGGPAYRAGIHPGDTILEYAGHPVNSSVDLLFAVWDTPKGGRVPIRLRGTSVIVEMPGTEAWPADSNLLGIKAEPTITPNLRAERRRAFQLYLDQKMPAAAKAYEDLARKCETSGDWVNYARSMAIKYRAEATGNEDYKPGITEPRAEALDKEILRVSAAGNPSATRILLYVQYAIGWGSLSETPRGRAPVLAANATRSYGDLRASLADAGWPRAMAALCANNNWPRHVGVARAPIVLRDERLNAAKAVIDSVPNSMAVAHLLWGACSSQSLMDNSRADSNFEAVVAAARQTIDYAHRGGFATFEANGLWTIGRNAYLHGYDELGIEAFRKMREVLLAPNANLVGYASDGFVHPYRMHIARALEGVMLVRRYAVDDGLAAIEESRTIALPEWITKTINPKYREADQLNWDGFDYPNEAQSFVLNLMGQSASASSLLLGIQNTDSKNESYLAPHYAVRRPADLLNMLSKPASAVDLTAPIFDPNSPNGNIATESQSLITRMYVYRVRAVIEARQGKRAQALADLNLARQHVARFRPGSRDRAELALDEARVYDAIGTSAERSRAWRQAVAAYRAESATALGESGRQYAGSLLAAAGNSWVAAAALAGNGREALEALESTRAASLLNAMAAQDSGSTLALKEILKKLDLARLQQGDALGAIEVETTRLKDTSISSEERTDHETALSKAKDAAARLQVECENQSLALQRQFADAQRALKVPAVDSNMALRRMPADMGYVGYAIGERSVAVVAARQGKEPLALVLSISPDALNKKIDAFRSHVTDRHSAVKPLMSEAKALGDILLPPRLRIYLAGTKWLTITPDGPLWDLPFAALRIPNGKAQCYLVEKTPVQYSQSLTVLLDDRRPRSTQKGVLVVGDPDYKTQATADERSTLWAAGMPPARLPATAAEAKAIAGLYGASPLLGADATERAVRNAAPTARIIHLAAHGYFNPASPAAAGILLAPGPDPSNRGDDVALQSAEILRDLKLDADLVVLSACETARGRFLQGEGVVGLTRSLQVAGARAILASQWKVADRSTSELMTSLHRGFAKGLAGPTALQTAMLATMKTQRHPYYWSPFVLVGRATR